MLLEPSLVQTPYVLFPGDSIVVSVLNNGKYKLSSEDSIRNNELDFFVRLCNEQYTLRPLFFPMFLDEKTDYTLGQRDSIIEAKYTNAINFLERYSRNIGISLQFKILARRYIDHARMYHKFSIGLNRFDNIYLRRFYEDSCQKYIDYLSCEYCLVDPIFRDALIAFVKLQATKSRFTKSPAISLDNMSNAEIDSMINFTDKTFKGGVKDYIFSKIIQKRMYDMAKTGTLIKLDTLFDRVETPNFRGELNDIFDNINSKIDFGNKIPEDQILYIKATMNDSTTFKEVLSRNKLLLIDFWATWCRPCIEEFEDTKKNLSEFPKDKFEIIFVSLDEDRKRWLAFNSPLMTQKNSYLLRGSFMSPIVQKYFRNSGIPHYILIDKEGDIISANAPRPSDKKLWELIRKNID